MKRLILLFLATPFLTGMSCGGGLLPYQVPDGGRLFRCSQIAGQTSGLPTTSARVDTCQCYQAGEPIEGTIDIKMPGCEVHATGAQQ